MLLAQTLNEVLKFYNTIASDSWTPTVRGSGTAGTYQTAVNRSRYTRFGRLVKVDFSVQLAAVVTGGGTGYLQVTGLPFVPALVGNPVGAALLLGVDFTTTGASLSMNIDSTGALYFFESSDIGGSDLQISAVGANDILRGSIWYETDDP
jgi:hypothetical protein